MKEPLGTALGLTLGTLLYDLFSGKFDGGSFYRAAVAFFLSFVLLTLLAAFKKSRNERD